MYCHQQSLREQHFILIWYFPTEAVKSTRTWGLFASQFLYKGATLPGLNSSLLSVFITCSEVDTCIDDVVLAEYRVLHQQWRHLTTKVGRAKWNRKRFRLILTSLPVVVHTWWTLRIWLINFTGCHRVTGSLCRTSYIKVINLISLN